MSDYTKTTDFDVKDSLPSGDTGKIIRGSEFEVEFENIEVAIASKADATNPTFAGTANFTNVNITGNTTLGNAATDTVTVNADFSSDLLPSADATYDLGAVGSEWQDLYVTGTANVDDLSCGTASFSGDLAVDTNTLFVDVSADRVGINKSNPSEALEINGNLKFSDGAARTIEGALNQNLIINSLGNLTGEGVDLRVNGTSVLLADFTGNVGIGTTTPATKLDVNGDVKIGSLTGSGTLNIRKKFDGTAALNFERTSAGLPVDASISCDGAENLILSWAEDTSTPSLLFKAQGSEVARIDPNGNVGIGTTTPDDLLEVSGTSLTATIRLTSTAYSNVNTISAGDGTLDLRANITSVLGTSLRAMTFGVGPTEDMRIDNSGNVGIGTDSFAERLSVHGASGNIVGVFETTTGNTNRLWLGATSTESYIDATAGVGATNMVLKVASTERMRIDASGNVGIGTTAPAAKLEVASDANTRLRISDSTNANQRLDLEHNAGFSAITSGNNGANGVLAFYQNDGTTTTEAMRIDSSGNLLVGKVTSAYGNGISLFSTGLIEARVNDGRSATFGRGTTNGELIRFLNSANADVGSIDVTPTTTAYNTSSDVRLKENITDAPEGNIEQLQVRSFDWKVDGSHVDYGFIAQELETVAPYAVTKGETEEDMWSVDYSKLVPMLVKEIQQLRARVATLEGQTNDYY